MNAFLAEKFFAPPREYQAVYAWPWNSAITQEVIRRELDEMLQMGIRSVYIIPMPMDFRPQGLRARLEPGYLTDAFFRLVRFAAQEARKRDMDFWLYDEGDEKGMTIVFITHDLGLAYYVSDTLYIMEHGKMVETGAAEEIILKPTHRYTRQLVADVPKLNEEWELDV